MNKIRDVKNYSKILRIIQSSEIKWLISVAFSVYFWYNFPASVLVAVQKVNNLDFGNVNEGYESD